MSPGMDKQSGDIFRDKVVMFFKHSNLKLSQTKTSSGATSANLQSSYFQPCSLSTSKPEMEKDCRQWNLDYDSCSCHKLNSHAFIAHHKCRMCTKEHPMLHCPKRRNPIYVTTMRVTQIGTAYFPFDQGLAQ